MVRARAVVMSGLPVSPEMKNEGENEISSYPSGKSFLLHRLAIGESLQ